MISSNIHDERIPGFESLLAKDYKDIEKFFDKFEKLEKITNEINGRTASYPGVKELISDHLKALSMRLSAIEREYLDKDEIGPKSEQPENIFEFKKVNLVELNKIIHVKGTLYDFYKWIVDNVPENKERSTAILKLEECAMWINKSVSRGIENDRQQKSK